MNQSDVDNDVVDSFQAFLVEGAQFTEIEEYPILRSDMVPTHLPERIMPFEKAISYHGDLSKTVICSFSPDRTFERIRRYPSKYMAFFKRTAGIIGFDYSVHSDMPLVKQKSQMNDNLSLSFYFGSHGIPLYPSCRCGTDVLEDEYLSAFPKNTLIALGVHGFVKKKWQKQEWRWWIQRIIDVLHPAGFIVVGHLDQNTIAYFSSDLPFYVYDSFIEERCKETKKHVD